MFEKIIFFSIMFSHFFVALASQNGSQIRFFTSFFENVDLVKILTKHWLCAENQGSDFKKSTKNQFNNALGEGIAKNLPKPPQVPPKSTRGANTWSLERVWFRDAMQVARKSSEGNGRRRL